jgi:hypothetical protein
VHGSNARNLSVYYLYLKLKLCISYYLLFSLQQNQGTRVWNRFCPEEEHGGGEVAQTMYAHVSKCKNDKIKKTHVQSICTIIILLPL